MQIENTKTILLVEDETILAMSEKISLEEYGYAVITASTGEEAVTAVKTIPSIDLILMDINLGDGIDGTQAAEIILKQHDIPILFLSSHIEPEIVEKTEKISSYGYVVKSSSKTVINASIKMAFKLFNAHREIDQQNTLIKSGNAELNKTIDELERNRNRLSSIFRAAPTGIGIVIDRKIVEVNRKICEITGYKENELTGKSSSVLYPSQEEYEFVGREKYLQIKKYNTGSVETKWKCKNGKIIDVLLSSTPIDVNDLAKGVTFTALDITERKRAEIELKKNEKTLSFIMDGVPALLAYMDTDLHFIYINQAHADWHGKDKSELIGKSLSELLSEDAYRRALPKYSEVLKGETVSFENKTRNAKGEERYLSIRLLPNTVDGEVKGFFASLNDITETKHNEKKIEKELFEKKNLLKEVHHRMKNNIASIENLLIMQMQDIRTPAAVSALQEAVTRVQGMRIIYDKLLISNDYKNLSVKEYLEQLIDAITTVFSDSAAVTIVKRIKDFEMKVDTLIPLGIIINELLTNTFKYAFKDKTAGRIIIDIEKTENEVTLKVQDNGVGLSADFDLSRTSGFGLKIVGLLTEQLGGTFTIENYKGARSIINFSI